jgi:hypothetical protein
MKSEIDYLRRFALTSAGAAVVLALFCLLLIASRVVVSRIYTNIMLQDLLSLLDTIYRIHSGQIIHRDFSSVLGLFSYALPAAFMSLGAGLVTSVSYSEAVFVAVAFFIYLYMQKTRLDPLAGFFLGVWIPLALLARMTFGEPLQYVTEAMQYNRRCDVFLVFLLLLFMPPSTSSRKYLVIDGVLYGAISAFLFYTKVTFGLVALGFAPIMLIRRRENIGVIAISAITFIIIGIGVEFLYGTHFAWLTDLRTAGESVSRNGLNRTLHIVRDNSVEVFGFLLIPAFILAPLRKLTIPVAFCCIYIAAASILIVSFSGQSYVLSLPIAFLFVALDALKAGPAAREATGEILTRYVLLSALASCLLLIESYPLAMNIGIATVRAIQGVPLDGENEILRSIVTDNGEDEGGLNVARINAMPKLDVFAFARATRPRYVWDNLSMREYADYLESGISAARAGCENRARISTIDVVNPFPMLLGWPPGGGLTFVGVGYQISERAHLPSEVMFRDINCIMIPKAPVHIGSRDTLLSIYWPSLSKSFEQSYESDLWTVFRRHKP